MERVMSVEEKIRRAEEIYQRRKQGEIRPVAKVSVNNEKKDIKLFKKMIIQIIICIVIYLTVYAIRNNEYIFSQDFISKVNEILSYDTNFVEIYEGIKNQISNFGIKKENNEEENQTQNDSENDEESNQTESNSESSNENDNETNNSQNGSEENKIEDNNDQNSTSQNQVLQNEQGNNQGNNQANNIENLTQAELDIQNIKNTTTFIKPIEGIITSRYGQTDRERSITPKEHTGTDIAANLGTKIKSATSGEVVLVADQEGGYGKYVKIQIGEVSIIYAHCNNIYIKQGDKVTQGQEIAEVGTTGNSTGPHLHFEVRISERTVDPQSILDI